MRRTAALRARLLADPRRFGFDAAARVLMRDARTPDAAEAIRFRTMPGLAYPGPEVASAREVSGRNPELSVTVMGLTGPSGVLPRAWTEALAISLKTRSRALHDFVDVFSHRMIALFARAGAKYRLARNADFVPAGEDPVSYALLSFAGHGTPHLVDRFAPGAAALVHYAGLLSSHPRSSDRLAALLSDWLGRPVEVQQFAGAWLALPPSQRSRLGVGRRAGQHAGLGVDAAVGVRAWDSQGRFVLKVGPLSHAEFSRLLPDARGLKRLVALARAYAGPGFGFSVNLRLAGREVPPLRLDGGARLGWDGWLTGRDPGRDALDANFDAEVVERA
jgi:type VI secretion system protein ImpH